MRHLRHMELFLSTTSCAFMVCAFGAKAQETPAPQMSESTTGDIIVTARRREEQSIDVPVAISAVTAAQLDAQGLTNLSSIASQVPQLKVDSNIVSFGGTLTLRGVSSATSTASIEQAVTVNIDGVPVSYAGVVRLGQFDLGQVEILRGPQALFFGKNATGGIISLRSAEPTDRPDAMVRAGYEFEAAERFTEGFISGPLTDTLKARLAVRYSNMDGWIDNIIPAGTPGAFGPHNRKAPGTEEFNIKGAITFEPTDRFVMKLRGAYSDVDTQATSLSQRFYCPTGRPQGPSVYPGETDCALDNRTVTGDLNPALNAIDPRFPTDGVPFTTLKQSLMTADLSYNLSDTLALTSLTGLYNLELNTADHVTFGPIAIISFADTVKKRTWSEEVRLTSSLDGPFNFMAGLFYQNDRFSQNQTDVIGPRVIPQIGPLIIKGETLSPFIQASYELFDQLTFSSGVRYSKETKRQYNALYGDQLRHKISFEDWSPEFTIGWKPAETVNIYGSYKEGYKSGGFQTEFISIPSALVAGANVDNSYDAEFVKGFEVGLKAKALNGALRFNLAAYSFKYSNLQLGRFDPVLVTTVVENIGSSRTKGIEADFQYRTPLDGLSLSGAIAYNRSRYIEFLSACYNGQTAALGCDLTTRLQNLAGQELPRAPKWTGNATVNYEGKLSDDFKLRINAGANFSASYQTMSESIPAARQAHYTTYDAGFSFGPDDERWDVAFIGRNLGNKFYGSSAGQVPITGSATAPSDLFTTINRGRELTARLTIRPFAR